MMKLTVNGVDHEFDGDPSMPVLWFLRDELKLKGTKFGCGAALCGACTIHVDGQATRSCVLPLSAVEGSAITTIEGLDPKGEHPLQQAWIEHQVPQCGYCQGGQIMQAASLLDNNPSPTDEDIINNMSGNICRCGTYPRIHKAIKSVAQQHLAQTDDGVQQFTPAALSEGGEA